EEELNEIESSAKARARKAKQDSWNSFLQPILDKISELNTIVNSLLSESSQNQAEITQILNELNGIKEPIRKDAFQAAVRILRLADKNSKGYQSLKDFNESSKKEAVDMFNSFLYSN